VKEQCCSICSTRIAFDAVADLCGCQPSATDAQALRGGAAKIAALSGPSNGCFRAEAPLPARCRRAEHADGDGG